MVREDRRNVTRPRQKPSGEEILEEMTPNRCYVVADLVAVFEDENDPSRWTVQNRLDELAEQGDVERVDHVNGRVTYRRPKSL